MVKLFALLAIFAILHQINNLVNGDSALTIMFELRRRMSRPYFEMVSKGEVKHKVPLLTAKISFGTVLNYLDIVKVCYSNKPEDILLE